LTEIYHGRGLTILNKKAVQFDLTSWTWKGLELSYKYPRPSTEESVTPDAAKYYAIETLRNGRRMEIRALRPDDRDRLSEAVNHASPQSLYRRFFGAKRYFTEKEIRFFVDVDFIDHVALVAVAEEDGHPAIVGGGRYVTTAPGTAEVAFMVVDRYQGLGLGAALMRHLTLIAREAGLRELTAEVLPSNKAMLKVFEKSGLALSAKTENGSTHVALRLN
jgi:RimJ/RimL family protein N-acetyltransferase